MANPENVHLNNLLGNVEATRQAVSSHVQAQGENATFADRFLLEASNQQHDFLADLAANDALLTSQELAGQEVAPHLTLDAQVTLDGRPVANHEVDIKFFGQFLVHLQDVTNALAQARAMIEANSGRFRASVVSGNRLRLATLSPGSVGVGLRIVPEKADSSIVSLSLPFDEIEPDDAPNLTLEDLRLLFDGSASNAALVDRLSNERVKSHYKSLVDLIVDCEATVSYRTQANRIPVRLTREQAIQRAFWLKEFRVEEKLQIETGVLAGGSVERNRFEFRFLGDDSNVPIEGKTTAHANAQMRGLKFGDEVRATMRVQISTNPEILTEKRSYTLVDIAPAGEVTLDLRQKAA